MNVGKKIADDIAAKKGMTVLTLEGNTLGVDAAEVIGDSLKMHSTLKVSHGRGKRLRATLIIFENIYIIY